MKITPDDIRSQRFPVNLVRGLNPEEVFAFLEDVADAYEELGTAHDSLMERLTTLQVEIQARSAGPFSLDRTGNGLREMEAQAESVKPARERGAATPGHLEVLRAAALREVEALLHDAQAEAHAVIESAKEWQAATLRDEEAARARLQVEADSLLTGAIAKADFLTADARNEEAALRAEIERLSQSRLQLIDDIGGTLDTFHHWLATVDPRGRAGGWHEGEPSNGDAVNSSNEAREG
jgi:DivIVA domain-containing protein